MLRFKYLLYLFLLIPSVAWSACDCGSTDQANPCTGQSISVTVATSGPDAGPIESDFNWVFNSGGGDANCGQFANGDYWVSPAPGQATVTITDINSTEQPTWITADANPNMESRGILDNFQTYGNYDVNEEIIHQLPISYSGIDSLFAAIQRDEVSCRAYDGDQATCEALGYKWVAQYNACTNRCGTSGTYDECMDSMHIVTVLPTVPENAGSTIIRPNITGETKELLSLSDFDLSLVPSLSYLVGADAAGLEAIRNRWSHNTEMFGLKDIKANKIYSEGGRAFRSLNLIDDYGGGMAQALYNDLMTLFSDDNTIEEKTPAIAAIISFGLDLYHSIYDPPVGHDRGWATGATQHPGKFIAPVLLGALSTSDTYSTNLKTVAAHAHDENYSGPAELAQITRGANGPVWGDAGSYSGTYITGAYWGNLFGGECYDTATGACNQNVGPKTLRDPHLYIDGPSAKPGTSYIISSLGPQRALTALTYLMPEMCDIVNSDDLSEYVLRAESHGIQTSNDPCVTPDTREIHGECDAYRNENCVYYGITWGPEGAATGNPGDCIKTPTPPFTEVGRFKALDGGVLNPSYTSAQVEANWSTIVNAPLCTGTEAVVPIGDLGSGFSF